MWEMQCQICLWHFQTNLWSPFQLIKSKYNLHPIRDCMLCDSTQYASGTKQ